MADIKPIETIYNGYRFRSRLEARWAVFFDAVGINYKYELEGYEMNGVRYLPDFYLPDADRWIEIKGKKLSLEEVDKCSLFCEAQDKKGVKFTIFINDPLENLVGAKPDYRTGKIQFTYDPNDADVMGIMGFSYAWKTYDLVNNSTHAKTRINDEPLLFLCKELCEEETFARFMPMLWVDGNIDKQLLISGAITARKARFEFGETPQVTNNAE